METPCVPEQASEPIVALRRSGSRHCAVFSELGFRPGASDLVIGKAPGCDIQITDEDSLSAQHAALSWRDGKLWIRDLGSTNGTKVQNLRISGPVELTAGSYLRLGFVELICVGEADDVPLTAARVSGLLREAKRVHGSARRAAEAVGMARETFRRRLAESDADED